MSLFKKKKVSLVAGMREGTTVLTTTYSVVVVYIAGAVRRSILMCFWVFRPIWLDQLCINHNMARPRRPKTFFPHIDPMERFSDKKFVERYRLPKDVVRALATDYEVLGFCSTSLDARGGGLSGIERVSVYFNYLCQTWFILLLIFSWKKTY